MFLLYRSFLIQFVFHSVLFLVLQGEISEAVFFFLDVSAVFSCIFATIYLKHIYIYSKYI